ncbi:MAG TPA: extracellular solute-binding protein [Stellaceae bacterium]|nr:extracellular solute-binding protein [Stellaceae bacterium]
MRTRWRSVLVLAIFAASAAAEAGAADKDFPLAVQAAITKAKAEGKLQLTTPPNVLGGGDGTKLIEDGIERMFGVTLAIGWAPSGSMGQLASKLYEEYRAGAPSSSDVVALAAVQIMPYLDKGLFLKVDWPSLMPDRITPAIVEGDGQALRVNSSFTSILYNPRVAPWVKDIDMMADALKPEYKGKYATTVFLAGFDVLLAKDVWGIDKTTDYVRAMVPQLNGLMHCDSEDRVASGETGAVILDCTGAAPNRAKFRGQGVLASKIVRDAAHRRYYYMLVTANAAHPNAAVLYALYLSSPEGQRTVMWDLDGNDLDSYPESQNGKRVKALADSGVKFLDVTLDWWRKEQSPELAAAQKTIIKLIERLPQ